MSDDEICRAFDRGRSAELAGKSHADNPYMPLTEDALYQAWTLGWEEGNGPSYVIAAE